MGRTSPPSSTSCRSAAHSGSAADHLLSPKLSLILGPWRRTESFFNAGRGFHGNDARGMEIGARTPRLTLRLGFQAAM